MRLLLATALMAVLMFGGEAAAQAKDCITEANAWRISEARSNAALIALEPREAASYRERITFAVRDVMLNKLDAHRAGRLLQRLPRDEAERAAWLELADDSCAPLSRRQFSALGRLSDGAPEAVSRAAVLAPSFMDAYVRFVLEQSRTVDPEIMDHVGLVCRRRHAAFVAAVRRLPGADLRWFTAKVFEPVGCKEIRLPEARD